MPILNSGLGSSLDRKGGDQATDGSKKQRVQLRLKAA
jgi:hypothetical protein